MTETVADIELKVTGLVTALADIGNKIDALKAGGGVASQQDLEDIGAIVDQAVAAAATDSGKLP